MTRLIILTHSAKCAVYTATFKLSKGICIQKPVHPKEPLTPWLHFSAITNANFLSEGFNLSEHFNDSKFCVIFPI
jgi:nitrite reductase/ring-hydroxylating ferredoxin subunit